ncbi:expressed unknown protein [Seminavis robusta]|uniref:Uncharacterized protein n=1 Tax=Seminavis robusta TaxID=568900 RepID=A0A9N8DN90_9STRA|nr:expressed unknown protein [Seminavis robusta]|eukprot:Sro241_g096450.1 n/a (614) ;mRNA; f:65869-67810
MSGLDEPHMIAMNGSVMEEDDVSTSTSHPPSSSPPRWSLSLKQRKVGLLVFSVLYIPLFAGAFFGFGPMQLMLEESGAFHSLCPAGNDTGTSSNNSTYEDQAPAEQEVCPEQTARLLTIPFVGQTMILVSPLLGIVVDRWGPVALMSFLGLCGCAGVAFLVAAVAIPHDYLLFVAFVGIGLMSTATSIMTVKTGMVFADPPKMEEEEMRGESEEEDKMTTTTEDNTQTQQQQQDSHMGQRRVISGLNALFDAGSVTYLGLWGIYQAGPSISVVFGLYLILAFFCFGGVVLFWVALGEEAFPTTCTTAATTGDLLAQDDDDDDIQKDNPIKRSTLDTVAASTMIIAAQDESEIINPAITSGPTETVDEVDVTTTDPDNPEPPNDDTTCIKQQFDTTTIDAMYVPIRQRTHKEQLLSWPFGMLVLFFAINLARNQFVLTTARDYLAYLGGDGNDEQSQQYLATFTLLMPASIVGVPFTDQMVARFGFHAGFQTVCFLGAMHGLIQLFCQELNGVQIFGFLVFSFYRCFLFSIVFSYIPTLLSGRVVGKGVGVLHLAGGAASFWNIPLSNVTVKQLDGNFFIPNLLYTLLIIPCSVAAYVIGRSIRQETRALSSSS